MAFERKGSHICLSCQSLTKIFNRSIKEARRLEDPAWESQLKEKREYFLRELADRDCNAATNLLLKTKDDLIASDSDVLNGKRWEEVLEESFQNREVFERPSPHSGVKVTAKSGLFSAEPIGIVEEFNPAVTPTCSHDWIEYYGAGLKPPETICSKCGQNPKAAP